MIEILNSNFKVLSLKLFCVLMFRSIMIRVVSQENLFSGFPTSSHINGTVQPQKMARGLKFLIKEEERIVQSMQQKQRC